MKPLAIKNSWVLVTGASTGLGRASALRLAASYQAKPLIVGRRLDNLRELQTEIDERFNVPCEIIVADQREIEGREKIAAKVAELQVTAALLVAGMTSVGSFDAGRADTYAEVIETNILGFTDLLARLIAIFREQPFESSVIAVSSLAGETSVPFQAVYGASKAYVSTLMRALSVELAGTGVSVGSFAPGGIDTDMAALSDLKWGRLGLMDVDRCARSGLSAILRHTGDGQPAHIFGEQGSTSIVGQSDCRPPISAPVGRHHIKGAGKPANSICWHRTGFVRP